MKCYPNYGTRTTDGTRKDFKEYAAQNKTLDIFPKFYLLSDDIKKTETQFL
jgi:hypothetical protein